MRVAVASAGPYAYHLHLAPHREPRQYLTTLFLQARCLPATQPTASCNQLLEVGNGQVPVGYTSSIVQLNFHITLGLSFIIQVS